MFLLMTILRCEEHSKLKEKWRRNFLILRILKRLLSTVLDTLARCEVSQISRIIAHKMGSPRASLCVMIFYYKNSFKFYRTIKCLMGRDPNAEPPSSKQLHKKFKSNIPKWRHQANNNDMTEKSHLYYLPKIKIK